jgi:NAD(P)H-nitrite reductase large subunit
LRKLAEIDPKRERIVIIGNGIAGNSAISSIRTYDNNIPVTLISEEKDPLYSPCAFHKYLSGEIEEQKLFLKTYEDYRDDGVEVNFDQYVNDIDFNNRRVFTGKKSIYFSKLVLATGSRALIPPIEGVNKNGIFALKSISDARRILSYPANNVVVIGSGPIGIEAAVAFRKKGKNVTLIEVMDHVLPRLLNKRPASIIKQILEEHGMKVLTGEKVTKFLGNSAVEGVITDKRQLECNLAVMAAGVRPNTEIAIKSGLKIGRLGGIATDSSMMTSIEDVYACGDCIESKDIFSGENTLSLLWHNARRQGWIAGCNCAGKTSKFIGSSDATTIEIFGHYISSVGKSGASFNTQEDYELAEKTTGLEYRGLLTVNNRLVGMQLIGRIERAGLLVSKMIRKDRLDELGEIISSSKLLSMKPWHYLASRQINIERR